MVDDGSGKKKRVVITLPKDLVDCIDLQVKKGIIPNRSYGIERIKFTIRKKK